MPSPSATVIDPPRTSDYTRSPDFTRLWFARAASDAATAIAMGAIPLIAVRILDASTLMISLITAVSGIVGALCALPLGPSVDRRRKRPTMIAMDISRAILLMSVPIASGFGLLTFTHLLVVASVTSLGAILFSGASTAHLKDLVPSRDRTHAIGKLESTFWVFNMVGPAAGGAVVQVLGATATLALQAIGLLLSALGVSRIQKPESTPPRTPTHHFFAEAGAGFTEIFRHPILRALFINSTLFAGMIAWLSPLELVLLLRDLHLPAWQYGLALALPSLGGVIGSWIASRYASRHGQIPTLITSSVLRGLPVVAIAFTPTGLIGVLIYIVANSLLLTAAGVFRPVYSAVRLDATPDAYLARVTTAFTLGSRGAAPIFALLGGILASILGIRSALLIGAILLIASTLILPWRHRAAA
ncbi:MFS transporter [Devriesea agamarum]|uniref:MFS transporter n=1 Tax=Devriesea agamarum TaxID=472569 RepID=UPI00155ECEE4|nr:MFS transporter [Devriesea agamarum]